MKRILIFSTAYVPFVGGAEVAIKEITDRLPEISFDMITGRFDSSLPKVEKIGNITVYRVGVGIQIIDKIFFLPFVGAYKTWRLNTKNKYDAFWCVMATYASGGAYIFNIFSKHKVPIILTLQEGDSEEHLTKRWAGMLHLSWKLALPRTTILTGISTYLGERAKRFGYKGEPVLIPNGVDLQKFQFLPHAMKDPITLITTSRLNVKNAVADVIDAMPLLPENVHFQILGVGELEKSLKLKVKSLKLENRVKFLGLISQTELPKYLHEADIFIRPSLSEGQGISFIEGMAVGLPVIATPVGGIPDFLKDGETGLFVNVHDPKSIADAVNRLIADPALKESLTSNARKMVVEKYDWNLIAESMKKRVFDKLDNSVI